MSDKLTMDDVDVKRASATILSAKEHKMFDDPLPESPEERISLCERIVAMARQAKKVADESGDKGVNMDAIMDVLTTYEVDGGTDSSPHQENGDGGEEEAEKFPIVVAGVEVEWTWDAIVEHVIVNGNTNLDLVNDEDRERLAKEIEAARSKDDVPEEKKPESKKKADPKKAEPVADTSNDDKPHSKERWANADGEVYIVKSVIDDEALMVAPDTDHEDEMAVPSDFLVKKVADEQTEEPAAEEPAPVQETEEGPSSEEHEELDKAADEAVAKDDEKEEVPEEDKPEPAEKPSDEEEQPTKDDHYNDLLSRVQDDFKRDSLPIPKEPDQAPEMPFDLTKEGDVEVRQLHSQMNACHARAAYVGGLEGAYEFACKRVANSRESKLLLTVEGDTVTERKAQIADDEQLSAWRERQDRHAQKATAMKTLREIYEENVSVLSREWSMRSVAS